MNHLRQRYGTAHARPYTRRPANAVLPLALRIHADAPEPAALDPHARDGALARLEAALLMADEPLTARKLGEVAGLADARRSARSR